MKLIEIAEIIKQKRKQERLTQKDVSMSTGVGVRYISDLENAKPSCEIGKALKVLEALGIKINFQ